MRLAVTNLLRYFDYPSAHEKGKGDATALMQVFGEDLGAALLVRHLISNWGPTEILSGRCTTGKKKGPRLDRWLKTTREGQERLIQLEIKSWSAHAIGGQNLPLSATDSELRQHRIDLWNREWSGTTFKKPQAAKVLVPMAPPLKMRVEPAICYWDAIHPHGINEPLFQVPIDHNKTFEYVWVFSASTYLRSVGAKEIELPMPNAERRLDLLRWISSTIA